LDQRSGCETGFATGLATAAANTSLRPASTRPAASPARPTSVPFDSDGNRARSFGGVASQTIGKMRKTPTELKSARFARPETTGHSETEIAASPRLRGSHPSGKPL
jgi:hypothetical protein